MNHKEEALSEYKDSANLYSSLQMAKANKIVPYLCLRRVLTELPKDISLNEVDALLPFEIKPEYREATCYFTQRLACLRYSSEDECSFESTAY